MLVKILEEVEKEIEKTNKSHKEKGSEDGEIKMPDLVRSKIRDLERSVEMIDENCQKSERLLDEVERELDHIGIDFGPIRKDIEGDIANMAR